MDQPDPENPLRLARIEASDLSTVTELHRKAYRSSLLASLGHGMLERYIRWQFDRVRNNPWFVGAFDGDRMVGYLSGGDYTENIQVGFLMEHRGLTLWNTLLHPLVLLNKDFWTKVRNTLRGVRRYRHLSSSTDDASETPPETINSRANFHVLSIAVDPEARRRGVGRHLMKAAEEQARTRDAQTMDAMVHAENAASLALFKRAGFKVMTPGSSDLQLVKELS